MTRPAPLTWPLLALFLALPAVAVADGFMTRDLGTGGSPEACLDRAERSLTTWFRDRGAPDGLVQRGDWSVQGYDVPPGDVQVQFVCPWRQGEVVIALLFTYSLGPADERQAVIDGLDAIWQRLAAPLPAK